MKQFIRAFKCLAASVSSTNTYIQNQGANAYTDVSFLDNIGYHCKVTSGSPTGQFYVEGSNDEGLTWVDLGVDHLAVTAGVFDNSAAEQLASLNQFPFALVRIKYVNASGTGDVEAWITAKRV